MTGAAVFQTAFALLFTFAAVRADVSFDSELEEFQADPRLFFVNFTSSLVQVNATLLAYGLIFVAVLGAAVIALYYLFLESQNASSDSGYSYGGSEYGQYYNARSSNVGYDLSPMAIIQWIAVLQDAYENLDMNDIECHKKVICELMNKPEVSEVVGKPLKQGLGFAKYLELLGAPDELIEITDEYRDASSHFEGQKTCEELYSCPFSFTESYERNLNGNSL